MIFRHFLYVSLAALCSLGGIQSVSASYPTNFYGWYEAGMATVEDAKLEDFFNTPVNDNTVKFDNGIHVGIGIGCKVTRFVHIEVESAFNYNALKSIGGATASSGDFYRVPILLNMGLQLPNRTHFVPVIGVGAGAQWAMFDAQHVTIGSTTLNDSDDTWVFTYQGYAGVRYEFNKHTSLGIFYRYNVADGPSWDFDNAGNFKLDSIQTHSVSITFGWAF